MQFTSTLIFNTLFAFAAAQALDVLRKRDVFDTPADETFTVWVTEYANCACPTTTELPYNIVLVSGNTAANDDSVLVTATELPSASPAAKANPTDGVLVAGDAVSTTFTTLHKTSTATQTIHAAATDDAQVYVSDGITYTITSTIRVTRYPVTVTQTHTVAPIATGGAQVDPQQGVVTLLSTSSAVKGLNTATQVPSPQVTPSAATSDISSQVYSSLASPTTTEVTTTTPVTSASPTSSVQHSGAGVDGQQQSRPLETQSSVTPSVASSSSSSSSVITFDYTSSLSTQPLPTLAPAPWSNTTMTTLTMSETPASSLSPLQAVVSVSSSADDAQVSASPAFVPVVSSTASLEAVPTPEAATPTTMATQTWPSPTSTTTIITYVTQT